MKERKGEVNVDREKERQRKRDREKERCTWQYQSLCSMMLACLCLACVLRPTNHEPCYGIGHICKWTIRGCASAVLRNCNMIELLHAKLIHTYAATQPPLCKHQGRASVSLSVFQICWSLLKKGRVLDSPDNM
jgi:hypothetical protein